MQKWHNSPNTGSNQPLGPIEASLTRNDAVFWPGFSCVNTRTGFRAIGDYSCRAEKRKMGQGQSVAIFDAMS
jgi:hypothetical protein